MNDLQPQVTSEGVVWLIVVAVCGGFTIILNTIVLLLLIRFRWLQTTSNIIIGSMVITDILGGIAAIVNCLQGLNVLNKLNHVECVIYITVDFTISTASSLHVIAASIERYIAIQYPLHHVTICRKSRILKGLLVVWVCSFCFGLTSLLADYNGICKIIHFSYSFLTVTMMLLMYHVPLIVLCGLYAKITYTVIQQRKRLDVLAVKQIPETIGTSSSSKNTIASATTKATNAEPSPHHQSRSSNNLKPFVMISAIVGSYILFWCPFTISAIISQIEMFTLPENPIIPRDIPLILYLKKLTYLNSTANPIIYFLLGKEFRSAARKIFARD